MPHQCTNCDRTFPDGSKEMLSGCPDCGGNKFQFAPAGVTSDTDTETGSRNSGRSSRERRSIVADESDDEGTVSRAAETVRDWVSSSGSDSDSDSDPGSNSTTDPDSGGNRPWPETDTPASSSSQRSRNGTDTDDSRTFEEWPDTARPPADRTEPEPSRPDGRSTQSTPASDVPASDHSTPASSRPVMDDDEDTAQADARSAVVSPDDLPSSAPETEPEPVTDTEPTTDTTPPDHGRVVSEPTGDRPSLDELREELNDQFESIKIVNPGQYELNLMELYDREEYIVSLQEDGRYVIDVPDSWRDSDG